MAFCSLVRVCCAGVVCPIVKAGWDGRMYGVSVVAGCMRCFASRMLYVLDSSRTFSLRRNRSTRGLSWSILARLSRAIRERSAHPFSAAQRPVDGIGIGRGHVSRIRQHASTDT